MQCIQTACGEGGEEIEVKNPRGGGGRVLYAYVFGTFTPRGRGGV